MRWWLVAVRRSPTLCGLILLQFLVAPMFWSLWHPPEWLKLLVSGLVLGPIYVMLAGIGQRAARTLETADESAERTGRRPPVSVGAARRATFTWSSATGLRLILMVVGWVVLVTACPVMLALMWHDDPPQSGAAAAACAFGVLVLIAFPGFFGVLSTVGPWRQIHRTLADPAETALVTVIGVDPATGQWVLEQTDTGRRFCGRLLGGKRLLVAGDELLAEGILHTPANSWRHPVAAVFALTGPFGTVWAFHGELSTAVLSGTTTTTTV